MISLPRSLRVRLQLWHALILLCVVLSFGSLLYRQVIVSRWDEIDADLFAAGRVLEGSMREVPRPVLDSLAQDIGAVRGGRPPAAGRPLPGQPGPRQPGPRIAAQLEWESTIPNSLDNAWEHGIQLPRRLPAQLADPGGPAYYIIWREDGSVLKQQDVPYPEPSRPQDNRQLQPVRLAHLSEGGPVREVFIRGPHNTLICVGRPVGGEVHRMWMLAGQLLLAGGVILAAGLCGGWWLSRSAVEPIERMTATAGNINATNLSERVDLTNIDRELQQLGEVLNAMLGRLEQSFETQKRFAADASHELRTPLATILSTIELSLSKPRPAEEYQQQLLKCQRAARRMHELVVSLLHLTRSDADAVTARDESVDLSTLVQETVDSLRDSATNRSLTLGCQLDTVHVQGNPGELTQVATNLLQNAIAYNREGGSIEVTLRVEEEQAKLSIRDTGIGITAEDLPHIFERFYRVDKSRSQTSGHGLGLAIAQAIVEKHGGKIDVRSQAGQGSEFMVSLPIV